MSANNAKAALVGGLCGFAAKLGAKRGCSCGQHLVPGDGFGGLGGLGGGDGVQTD
jgi:hypothetical protein